MGDGPSPFISEAEEIRVSDPRPCNITYVAYSARYRKYIAQIS
jgi:hypothetical protein